MKTEPAPVQKEGACLTPAIEPENWQARLQAAIAKLDEAIESGDPKPAQRALEIANQLIAEAVVLDAIHKKL